MISTSATTLILKPSAESKAPLLTLPLLSQHVCDCGALLKAYARTEGRLPSILAYDPEKLFKHAVIDGGLVVLRERHGAAVSRCLQRRAVFTGPTDVARILVTELWHAYHHDAPPAVAGPIATEALAKIAGVHTVEDSLGRRPPVYLVDLKTATAEIVGDPDFKRFEKWRSDVARRISRLAAGFTLVTTPAIEIRALSSVPRRRRHTGAPPPVVVPPTPPVVTLPNPAPAPPSLPQGPSVQLSLFGGSFAR